MTKRHDKIQADDSALVNTSIRPSSLGLVKLAAPFVGESITDFLSGAANTRAMQILNEHNVTLPSWAQETTDACKITKRKAGRQ
jgi:uncharacterized protein (DUF1778 family)